MKSPLRNFRLWIALLVWMVTAYVFAAGMDGFSERHESLIGVLCFAAAVSAVLHGAYFLSLISRRRMKRVFIWAFGVGMLPATLLSSIVIAETVTKLPSRTTGFLLALLVLFLYADAWRQMLTKPSEPGDLSNSENQE